MADQEKDVHRAKDLDSTSVVAWVPQVFYDLIGRVVPGATVVAVALFLFSTSDRVLDTPILGAGTSAALTIVSFVIGSYVIGFLLGAIGFFVMEKEWKAKPPPLNLTEPPD